MTAETNQLDPENNQPEQTGLDQEEADTQQPEQATQDESAAEDETQDLAAELAKAQVTIKDYWDQIMRLNAEIENNRKRAQRDIEHAHKYATQQFAESLLSVADSMEMGIAATEKRKCKS